MGKSIEQLDVNFAVRRVEGGVQWVDIREFGVEGRAFGDVANFYDRLPARAQGVVTEAVWRLASHSAGMCVRFVTDARMINARWTVRNERLAMDHMPATGVSGLDLYVRREDGWRWIGVGRPTVSPTNQAPLVSGEMTAGRREMMLYLPLYNGVTEAFIGVPEGATIERAPAREGLRAKPICFYGTSILQGGCASRPGMAYPAIVSRQLDWDHWNFGFSGSARCEAPLAELFAELDPVAYLIDALPNMDAKLVTERMDTFLGILRKARPKTPIVLVESISYRDGFAVPTRGDRSVASNEVLRDIVQKLAAGGANVHLIPGADLLGNDGEGTVDGVHATDLGFARMADLIANELKNIFPAS
jgi:hypothetical protein